MPATLRRPGTVSQAAEHYGMSDRTIRRWIARGILQAWKVGPHAIRVDLDEVERIAKPLQSA